MKKQDAMKYTVTEDGFWRRESDGALFLALQALKDQSYIVPADHHEIGVTWDNPYFPMEGIRPVGTVTKHTKFHHLSKGLPVQTREMTDNEIDRLDVGMLGE